MGRKSENASIIIDTAAHTFWTKGYEGVGVNEICEAAGINKGTLYHFYRDKEELILAVIAENSRFVATFIQKHNHLRPLERVLAYFDMMRDAQKAEFTTSGRVAGCPFGNLSVEMGTRNQKIRKAVDEWFSDMVDFLATAVTEWQGSARGAALRADEIFTYWQGAILRAKTANNLSPIDKARTYTIRLFESVK